MNNPRLPRCGDNDYMHIHAQPFEHAEAQIVGTIDALKKLRDALAEAIETGRSLGGAIAADGEGYYIEIEVATLEKMSGEKLPYSYLTES